MDTKQVQQALHDLARGGLSDEDKDAAVEIVWDAVSDKIITDDTRAAAGEPDENGDATELTLLDWITQRDFSGITAYTQTERETREQIQFLAEEWDAETIDAEGYDAPMIALARFLECKISDITDEGDGRYREGRCEYLVGTDEEMDAKFDEYLDNYIDECILPEIPEAHRFYFDDEKWKRDARMDGRGAALASYDGNECEIKIDGVTYFIYRTN